MASFGRLANYDMDRQAFSHPPYGGYQYEFGFIPQCDLKSGLKETIEEM
jgi:hypothetical protein